MLEATDGDVHPIEKGLFLLQSWAQLLVLNLQFHLGDNMNHRAESDHPGAQGRKQNYTYKYKEFRASPDSDDGDEKSWAETCSCAFLSQHSND